MGTEIFFLFFLEGKVHVMVGEDIRGRDGACVRR
jgi:hypothetical protein